MGCGASSTASVAPEVPPPEGKEDQKPKPAPAAPPAPAAANPPAEDEKPAKQAPKEVAVEEEAVKENGKPAAAAVPPAAPAPPPAAAPAPATPAAAPAAPTADAAAKPAAQAEGATDIASFPEKSGVSIVKTAVGILVTDIEKTHSDALSAAAGTPDVDLVDVDHLGPLKQKEFWAGSTQDLTKLAVLRAPSDLTRDSIAKPRTSEDDAAGPILADGAAAPAAGAEGDAAAAAPRPLGFSFRNALPPRPPTGESVSMQGLIKVESKDAIAVAAA